MWFRYSGWAAFGRARDRRAKAIAAIEATGGERVTTIEQQYGAPVMAQPPPAAPASGSAQSGLEATNVSAWFGSHKVLERVSLSMEPGKVTALIGPSGCGKSTFLRILNRMHELFPSAALSGSVKLDGMDIYGPALRVTETRLKIGMVFQRPNPFPVHDHRAERPGRSRLLGHQGGQPRRPGQGVPGAGRAVEGDQNRLNEAGAPCRVASSSACASPGLWPSGPGCCSWTSRVRPSTRSRRASSRRRSGSSATR